MYVLRTIINVFKEHSVIPLFNNFFFCKPLDQIHKILESTSYKKYS